MLCPEITHTITSKATLQCARPFSVQVGRMRNELQTALPRLNLGPAPVLVFAVPLSGTWTCALDLRSHLLKQSLVILSPDTWPHLHLAGGSVVQLLTRGFCSETPFQDPSERMAGGSSIPKAFLEPLISAPNLDCNTYQLYTMYQVGVHRTGPTKVTENPWQHSKGTFRVDSYGCFYRLAVRLPLYSVLGWLQGRFRVDPQKT